MTNIEIEDVLSSIRRLVSDDVRSVQTRTRELPEAPRASEAVVDATRQDDTRQDDTATSAAGADAGSHRGEPEQAIPAKPEGPQAAGLALVLTPAQRVSQAGGVSDQRPDDMAANLAGWAADPESDSAASDFAETAVTQATAASAGSLEQTISELEAAVASIDGEFEQDWDTGTDTGEMSHDLEEVFRNPALRDTVTLEEAAGGLTLQGEPVASSGLDTDAELVSGTADMLADAEDWAADAMLSDGAEDSDIPTADMLAIGLSGSEQGVEDDDDLFALDQPITGDATTMVFGSMSDISAAASASLAALIAAPATAKATSRLHFGAAPVSGVPAARPASDADTGSVAATDTPKAADTGVTAAEPETNVEPRPDLAVELATQAANLTGAPEMVATTAPESPSERPSEPSLAASEPRHPRILRSGTPAEIVDEVDDDADIAAAETDSLDATAVEPAKGSDVEVEAGPYADPHEVPDDADAMNLFESTPDAALDVDALRDIVAEIIRQELQGVLGERITRNVRKLVRREINRVLETRTLE